jgi:aspartate aminotransferase-like enzyme
VNLLHKKLWIPGPTEVKDDVLMEQAKPLFGHRSKDLMKERLCAV